MQARHVLATTIAAFAAATLAGCGSGQHEAEDGQSLVFLSDRDNPEPEGGDEGFFGGLARLELYVRRPGGAEPVRLTDNDTAELSPACSPDGTSIAFTQLDSAMERSAVFLVDVDGGNLRRLTTAEASEASASWSPDGESLVVARLEETGATRLYVTPVDGGGERRLMSAGDAGYSDGWPAWSPRGDRIAFLRSDGPDDVDPDIFVVASRGGAARAVLPDVDGDRLAWSPDGEELAVTLTVDGTSRIWIVDVDSGAARRMVKETQLTMPQSSPAWSFDDRIAFTSGSNIAAVAVDGGTEVEYLTQTPPFETVNYFPEWCG